MKIWENGVVRDMTPEEKALWEIEWANQIPLDDPYEIIDTLTGDKQ